MMKKVLAMSAVIMVLYVTATLADVTINVSDLQEKVMRVTYTWVCDEAGATTKVYPGNGYTFATGPIKVVSVIEQNTEQELEYEVVPAPAPKRANAQSVKAVFPNPVPKGGNFKIQITVEATTDDIRQDSDGRYVFSYATAHQAFFVLPEGHAIVYSNFPVLVYEKQGRTVIQVKDSGEKELLFKTRAFGTGK